jgi:hypothetical protein
LFLLERSRTRQPNNVQSKSPELRKIINELPFLSISIDESSNVSHQEISSTCSYTLESVAGVTSRVCHVLKMHKLPGAIATALR